MNSPTTTPSSAPAPGRALAPSDGPVFRADSFSVPLAVLDDFMAQVQRVDRQLSALPGCRQHLVLMQLDVAVAARDCIQVMTLVEWADAQALEAAKAHLQQQHARAGFSPEAFMKALGVRAEKGRHALPA